MYKNTYWWGGGHMLTSTTGHAVSLSQARLRTGGKEAFDQNRVCSGHPHPMGLKRERFPPLLS